MKNFLFILMLLIGFVLNIQAQESAVKATPKVYVTGNVVDAKGITYTDSLTITQAIEKCGGMKIKKANFFKKAKKEAMIYRLVAGTKYREEIKIDFGKILKGKTEDVKLEPYDIIQVVSPKNKNRGHPDIIIK